MKKRIFAAFLAAIMVLAFAACSVKEIEKPQTTTRTRSTTEEETADQLETTEEETATTTEDSENTGLRIPIRPLEGEEPDIPVEPSKIIGNPTTKRETTTKKVTTTKKATTTKKETTTELSKEDLIVDEDVKTEYLKYGVIRTQTMTRYYQKLADGSEILVAEEVRNDVFNRIGYNASYAELLPSAKENAVTYRDYIEKILEITNRYRAEGGLAPLELDEKLIEIASVRAEELAWSAVHSHTRPNMRNFTTIFKDGGLNAGSVGENIGWGYNTPEEVCKAWRESESHYANIMNPNFKKVGFGVAKDPDKDSKLCWVQHFWDGKTND